MPTILTPQPQNSVWTGMGQPVDNLPYKPKTGYMSGYTVNADGMVSAKLGDQSMALNGVMLDMNALQGRVGNTAEIGKLKLDSKGNLIAQVTYEMKNPDYGKSMGFLYQQQPKTVMAQDWIPLSGFKADMNNISRASNKALPEENNVYLRPDGQGYLAEVEAIWQGSQKFTAAYARQLLNEAKAPAGDRLSSGGGMRRTSTLGGVPTSAAAGNKAADDINLRNRKGTLLT